jgi:glutathione S-transferase
MHDPSRGRFLQWMFFTGSCLEPAMAERMTGAPGNTVSFGWGDLTRVEQAIENALEEGPWLLGEQFTAADILAASTLRIAFIAKLLEPEGVLFDYVERSLAREGYERASAIDHREADRLALNTHVGLAHPSNEN